MTATDVAATGSCCRFGASTSTRPVSTLSIARNGWIPVVAVRAGVAACPVVRT